MESTYSFDENDNLVEATKIFKKDSVTLARRTFQIIESQLVITETVNRKTGSRTFDRQ